jgi:V/A-type H+-transporting ATPase subunit D
MAIQFHYNKTSLQQLNKQLKIRQNALPTLKNKESALRLEVKNAKDQAQKLNDELKRKMRENENILRLWNEFDTHLIAIKDVKLSVKKIAGVKTPVLDGVDFVIGKFSLFKNPSWFMDGIRLIEKLARIALERDVYERKTQLLEHARKKTTQKVNLYEKVQIPGYEEAILKIKRFMEDEENLSKASQKIVKSRMENQNTEEVR